MKVFTNYHDWRSAITGTAGLTLDRSYCEKRIAAMLDAQAPGTQSFIDSYGTDYRDQVIDWFRQALHEA
jgi:hypothetical protein